MSTEVRSAEILAGLRRRGEFLISAVMWAAVFGLLVSGLAWSAFFYHHFLAVAERTRVAFGFRAAATGPDWFLLVVLALPAVVMLGALWAGLSWYNAVWNRRLAAAPSLAPGLDRAEAEAAFREIEADVLERAFTTGLIVGVSGNRWLDMLTIVSAALELQLHVLTRLGRRPTLRVWRMLLQRAGASLFVNMYLTRQDALLVSLAIKKAGLGLQVAGDAMDTVGQHITDHDLDLDDVMHLNSLEGVPFAGIATKSLEIAATMAFTVGKQGLHALGALIENVGDQLAQGAIASAILYHHGVALAADALALDAAHRTEPVFNPTFAQGLHRMTKLAGNILLDAVRQRRDAFRERRAFAVRRLPKAATEGIRGKLSGWFGGAAKES